ncbi:MAG: DUF2791 family P-loop domain-containing protein [Solirubrobacteraceae bacterium]|nr:DUF2791 family P-loop domain-containing protein [Solirubrobacteraceae bacterium]
MPPDATANRIVGRDRELTELDAALSALGAGGSFCLAIEGDPGMGKTRLLAELRERATAQELLVLSGVAAEFERDVPFSVWVDALDAHVAAHDLSGAEGWDDELAVELALVLPSQRGGGEPSREAVADERFRAHRAIRRLLTIVAADRPVVLVLDDLHWGDRASLELLAAFLRRGTTAPVLVAVAFRRGQAPQRLTAALAVPAVTRLELEPLTTAQSAELVGAVGAPALAAICEHGGGNPFYLRELARASERGPLRGLAVGAVGYGVPPAVAAALDEELASLDTATRAYLEAASVAGEPFDPDVAAAVAELPPEAGLVALDDLLERDLVRTTSVPRRFIFRHPLVRRSIYDAAPGGWRIAAHARAATTLATRGAPATERAHHVEQAAAHGDADAIALLLEAGEAAAPRAPSAAVRWFEAALRLLPADDRVRQAEIRVRLASALRALGELERCRTTLLEAAALLPEGDDRRLTLTARCAEVEHWLGRHDEAHARITEAWEQLEHRDSAVGAAVQLELAVDGLYELDLQQTIEAGRGALDTARVLGDGPLIAAASAALALGEVATGDITAANRHRDEAVAQVERLTDAELAPRLEVFYFLGWAENYLEHYDDALRHVDRGIEIARATGQGRLLVPIMLVKGYPLQATGRCAESIEVCETAVEIAKVSENPHFHFWALFELGWARYYAGDPEGALAANEESVRVGGQSTRATMPTTSGGPGWGLGVAQLAIGQTEQARASMRQAGGDDLEHAIPVERALGFEIIVLAEIALGDLEAAERLTQRVEEDGERFLPLRLPWVCAQRSRAEVLLATGDPQGAAQVARGAAQAAQDIGANMHVGFSRRLVGVALAAAGDRDAAVQELREAERVLDVCGCIRVRDEVRHRLRELGSRPPRSEARSAGGVAALSPRELEIANLVCDRLTNRQMAAELFLSEKTIESHLRNVFGKLGVTSRVEVARVMERERHERRP